MLSFWSKYAYIRLKILVKVNVVKMVKLDIFRREFFGNYNGFLEFGFWENKRDLVEIHKEMWSSKVLKPCCLDYD